MTETRVIIDIDREATPDQMVSMQDGIENSIDHIVGDALVPTSGYAGLITSFSGTVVTVGAGRLYNGGKVYAFDTASTFDMLTKLPLATKRMVLIVAYGTEEDTNVQEVNYLIEAQSTPSAPVYQPQAVATTHQRLAVIQPAYGNEAPNPVAPDSGLALPIAQIILTPTGIASCVNLTDGKIPVLADVANRTAALEAWEAEARPEISTIASALAALANDQKNSGTAGQITRIFLSIADLDAKVGIPSNAADASADYLLDGTNSDLANALSSCKVMEGIRFPDDGASTSVFNLFNPFETLGSVKGGVLFPAYTRYLRQSTGPQTGTVGANAYTYNAVDYVQQTTTQQRTRYGTTFDVCTNSAFWQSGTYNPLTGIFTLPDGETYNASLDLNGLPYTYTGDNYLHVPVRLQQFWTDTVNVTYWDTVVEAPQTIPGFHMFETVLIGQDQWIDAVGVVLGNLDAQGDVTLIITEAGDNAQPDPTLVLASVTIPYAQLKANMENVFSLTTPVLLQSGQRISYGVVTPGAHQIATTDGANFPQGTFFALSPSGYAQGDLTKHLCMNFYGTKFNQSVASIQLQNLQLAGGITAIDILAPTIIPGSTTLVYEIQLGGVWTPLNAQTVSQLNAGGALPPNLPIRVTMTGTQDMMPALNLAQSRVIVSRPKTSFVHIWPLLPRTPPVPSSQIGVIERYESFDASFHTAGCKLLTGAGYTTETAPSSYSDVQTADGGLERTYLFNLGSAVSSYKVKSTGTTTSALKTFLGAWIKDYCL